MGKVKSLSNYHAINLLRIGWCNKKISIFGKQSVQTPLMLSGAKRVNQRYLTAKIDAGKRIDSLLSFINSVCEC